MKRPALEKRIIGSFLVVLLLLMLPASGTSADKKSAPAQPTTLNLAELADFKSLDASQAGDGPTVRIAHLLYSRLLRLTGKNNNELIPALAESMPSWSPDKLRLTFKLRAGTKFSDGSPLTTDDVAFTFTRLLDPKIKSPYQGSFAVIKGANDFIAGKAAKVAGIVVVDSRTIRFELEKTVPYFLRYIAMPVAGIVSRKQVEQYGDTYGQNPLGAGPYMLEKWTRGQQLVLTRNPHYYMAGFPKIDKVVEKVGVAANVQMMMLQKGDLDQVAPVLSADFGTVLSDPNLKNNYYNMTGTRMYYLGMNVETKPFDNKTVRQALNYAIDKNYLVTLLNGRAQVMAGLIPPWIVGYDESIKPYPYDPEKAKQLLAKAGYPDGFTMELLVPNYFDNPRIGQAVQNDLAKVGIKVDISQQAMPVFIATLKQRKVPMFLLQWTTDFADPQNVLSVLFHGANAGSQNYTWYNNPDVNKLLDQADGMMDPAKRISLYRQADKIIRDDAPWVFEVYAKADAVRSIKLQPPKDAFGRVPLISNEWDHFDAVEKKP